MQGQKKPNTMVNLQPRCPPLPPVTNHPNEAVQMPICPLLIILVSCPLSTAQYLLWACGYSNACLAQSASQTPADGTEVFLSKSPQSDGTEWLGWLFLNGHIGPPLSRHSVTSQVTGAKKRLRWMDINGNPIWIYSI